MGRYQVVQELGRNQEGGRITYLATDSSLEPPQQVVIKEFRFAALGANWSGFKAYEREIAILQQLEHPRIPRYLDSYETETGFCLVQEYKKALSLVVQRSFEPEDIKKIAVSVLEILVYLQKRTPPVIHRDIKPENILVDEQLNAYLVDFGFARIRGGELALSSVAAGTPGFMPPEEQFGRTLTEASDLYSLGATLICLLTGTRSLDVGNLIDDNYRFDFKKLVPQLSPDFISWLEKMVAPNVKQRYTNAAAALEALKPVRVVGGATGVQSLVSAIKHRKPIAVLGLATLSVVVGVGITNIMSQEESPATQFTSQASRIRQLLTTRECQGCNLQNANLSRADLQGVNLEGADLRGAKLWNANLRGAKLWNANLQGVSVWHTNLEGADLRGADLRGTKLWNTNLQGAYLWRAQVYSSTDLKEANLKGAIMPDGTKHP